jgi:ribonuclease Y
MTEWLFGLGGVGIGGGIAYALLNQRAKAAEQQRLQLVDELEKARKQQEEKRQAERDAEAVQREADRREAGLLQETEQRAKEAIVTAIERLSGQTTQATTHQLVDLPSADMKGRIIGREGRNIKAFEQITGVDLLIDDHPDAVVLSTFHPIRREVARLTLLNLMLDGRIHPARIDELHQKAEKEIHAACLKLGRDAAKEAKAGNVNDQIAQVLGQLHFRTSYGQNVLRHSVEVAHIGGMIAADLGLDETQTRRACLLHDIGKALESTSGSSHALAGMEFCRQSGEPAAISHAVGAHHREIEPDTWLDAIVIAADTASAARPGARRENLESYAKRLLDLEEMAMRLPGVERAYVMQAGREIQVIVDPEKVDDVSAQEVFHQLIKTIEAGASQPTAVRVTVIREKKITGLTQQ